jgi:hypothetical protein
MSVIEIRRDLRPMFGTIRDQRGRPTCVAFAASDAHAALRDGWEPLCCEYAFYHAQRRAGRLPTQGAVLPTMVESLAKDGQPIEAAWPYLNVLPANLSVWAPPPQLGKLHGRAGTLSSKALDQVIATLDEGRPVILLLMLSRCFFEPGAGGVIEPAIGEVPEPARRHAVIACGHGLINDQPALLVRNSWGPRWGVDGCGWLTQTFLKPRLFAAATLLEDVDVSAHSIAA